MNVQLGHIIASVLLTDLLIRAPHVVSVASGDIEHADMIRPSRTC
jgi:hypothetical protein